MDVFQYNKELKKNRIIYFLGVSHTTNVFIFVVFVDGTEALVRESVIQTSHAKPIAFGFANSMSQFRLGETFNLDTDFSWQLDLNE